MTTLTYVLINNICPCFYYTFNVTKVFNSLQPPVGRMFGLRLALISIVSVKNLKSVIQNNKLKGNQMHATIKSL